MNVHTKNVLAIAGSSLLSGACIDAGLVGLGIGFLAISTILVLVGILVWLGDN